MKANNAPLEIEKTYNKPIENVWHAITDKNKMKQWYFDIAEFKPEVGFEFKFYGGSEEQQYLHICKIIEVIPGKKLKHSWRYDGYPGESFVTFELFDEGDSTRLKLTHVGLDTLPQNNKDFAIESFIKGWTYFLGTALPGYLENA